VSIKHVLARVAADRAAAVYALVARRAAGARCRARCSFPDSIAAGALPSGPADDRPGDICGAEVRATHKVCGMLAHMTAGKDRPGSSIRTAGSTRRADRANCDSTDARA
jgi:hypothetical protein